MGKTSGGCQCGGSGSVALDRASAPTQLADYPWDECIRDQKKRGYSDEQASKICGYIKAKNAEGTHVTADDAAAELGLAAPRKRTYERRIEKLRVVGEPRSLPCVSVTLDAGTGRPRWIQIA